LFKVIVIVPLLAGVALLAGCNATPPKRDPEYAPVRPVVMTPPPRQSGSIYQAGFESSWFEDIRARRVGDILTIKLTEKTNANKKAKTGIDKSNKTIMENPTVIGTTIQWNSPKFFPLADRQDNNLAFDLESSTEFEGDSDSAQSNLLTGDITVTVVEVLSNGYLRVRGEKRIGINQGNEYIRLSGIVRPVDIDSTNTLLSTRLADPTMVYVGDGAVAESNAIGWLAGFFNSDMVPF
jgi:flagellar L-ring protein precursor FlgH